MKIGINAASISSLKGGVSFYIINIVRALASIDQYNHYIIFTSSIGRDFFSDLPKNFVIVPVAPRSVKIRLLWEQVILPYLCKKYKTKVLFCPNYTIPLFTFNFKKVVVLHDSSFFSHSNLFTLSRRIFKSVIKYSVKWADKVIAVSHFTKKDTIKYVGSNDEKIFVVHNAAHERFNAGISEKEINEIKKKFKIRNNYILFIGFMEPRKNINRLIDAYTLIADKISQDLIIAGGGGWWQSSTYEKIADSKIKERIHLLGYVPNSDLPALYTGATIFAFPTLYEGFGIVALESICCGTPVLASNNTSLPEVVKNAGVYVDPFNVEDIADKLLDILVDTKKLFQLKANCPHVGKQFSWKLSAEKTLEILTSW